MYALFQMWENAVWGLYWDKSRHLKAFDIPGCQYLKTEIFTSFRANHPSSYRGNMVGPLFHGILFLCVYLDEVTKKVLAFLTGKRNPLLLVEGISSLWGFRPTNLIGMGFGQSMYVFNSVCVSSSAFKFYITATAYTIEKAIQPITSNYQRPWKSNDCNGIVPTS